MDDATRTLYLSTERKRAMGQARQAIAEIRDIMTAVETDLSAHGRAFHMSGLPTQVAELQAAAAVLATLANVSSLG